MSQVTYTNNIVPFYTFTTEQSIEWKEYKRLVLETERDILENWHKLNEYKENGGHKES